MTSDFFGKTSASAYGCYAGILLFPVTHFAPMAAGMTPLPADAGMRLSYTAPEEHDPPEPCFFEFVIPVR